MAIERDMDGQPKRPEWEKFVLLLIAAGVAFVVAGGVRSVCSGCGDVQDAGADSVGPG